MTAKITYRKTGKGEWVAFGPADAMPELVPGVNPAITVTRKDGTAKTERVTDYGKVFTADGRKMRYAYLVKTPAPARRRNTWMGSYSCQDCQDFEDMGHFGGCERHRGNPRN